jgi:anaerobic selenocysteine-containing dehydrogenase
LITSCGNPVLSTPNGRQLESGLEQLELMVSIDIFLNETTKHAHYILPPATGLEVSHYDTVFHFFAVRNTAKYSPPLFDKALGAKYDWEILQELTHHLNTDAQNSDAATKEILVFQPQAPEEKIDLGLKYGPYKLSLQELIDKPEGIDLGPLMPCLPQRLIHTDKRIRLAPTSLLNDLQRVEKGFNLQAQELEIGADTFRLISRRHLRDNNSWLHNSKLLMKGNNRCTVQIHPEDALRCGMQDKEIIKISSRVGSVELPVEITVSIKKGVLSIPHGYGHGRKGTSLDIANKYAGASINDLTDELLIDPLTGNAAFSNLMVRISTI